MQPRLFAGTWAKVLERYSQEPAIYGNDRVLLRTFADIESERILWGEKLSGLAKGSIILVQLAEDAAWPAKHRNVKAANTVTSRSTSIRASLVWPLNPYALQTA